MANRDRQPKVERALPGAARYADAATNSVVGRNPKVETIPVDQEPESNPDIAPEANFVSPV